MPTQRKVDAAARRLAGLLETRNLKIVFAESCTGGLVAASLARVPGISNWLCGSAVVYQVRTKADWLQIPQSLLKTPGPVSREVAVQMAENVLSNTSQADVAVSVTGHLGPDAPKRQDGLLFVAVALGPALSGRRRAPRSPGTVVKRQRLAAGTADSKPSARRGLRVRRQRAAAEFVLQTACSVLEKATQSV